MSTTYLTTITDTQHGDGYVMDTSTGTMDPGSGLAPPRLNDTNGEKTSTTEQTTTAAT